MLAEVADFRFAFGQGEARKDLRAVKDDIDFFRELDGIIASLGEVLQRLAHLFFGFHVELVVRELHALGIIERGAHANAHHDVLRARVFLQKVVEVVRCDGFQAAQLCDFRKLHVQVVLRDAAIGCKALVLKLDVEIARLESGCEFLGPLHRFVETAVVQKLGDKTRDTGARADDALAVFLQHGERRARFVIEVVNVGFGNQLHQVHVPLVIFGKEQQVVKRRLAVAAKLIVGGEVHFATVNGLDFFARLFFNGRAGVAKLGHTRHYAVVGYCHSRHSQVSGAPNHIFDMRRTVEQRVFSVIVQVNKCHETVLEMKKIRSVPPPFSRGNEPSLQTSNHTSIAAQALSNKRWILRKKEKVNFLGLYYCVQESVKCIVNML